MGSLLAGLETVSRAMPPGRERGTLAAVGDIILASPLVAGASSLAHRPDSSLSWLGMLRPDCRQRDDLLLGKAGTRTTDLPSCLAAILAAARRPETLLISAGHEDCFATMRGVAPPVEESIAALEATAGIALAAGVRPVFIVPPPSAHFPNGLFAERYVTIAATLRRLALAEERMGLVDAVSGMTRPRAVGIEPSSHFVAEERPGRLTPAGALCLAFAMAEALGEGSGTPRRPEPVNPNPLLRNVGGVIATDRISGRCAASYRLDAEGLPPDRCEAMVLAPGGQRLRLRPAENGPAGFVRLSQVLPPEAVEGIGAGELMSGEAEVSVSGEAGRVANLCVTVTPVWDAGFAGLHSHPPGEAWHLRGPLELTFRTPRWRVPAPLKRLHLSIAARLDPNGRGDGETLIDIRSLSLRREAATDPLDAQ